MRQQSFQSSIVFLSLLLLLLGALAWLCSFSVHNRQVNAYYGQGFLEKAQKAGRLKPQHASGQASVANSSSTESSGQPEAPGMKESDIVKVKGNRYQTY